MRLLGLDVGANVGHALIERDGRTFTWLDGGAIRFNDPALRTMIVGASVDLIVIETPAGYAFSPARVSALMQAASIGGWCQGVAGEHDHRVMVVTAGEVRTALCGKANANDALVKAVLGRVVQNMPRTNSHARDAAAAAWYGAMVDDGKRFACAEELKRRRSK